MLRHPAYRLFAAVLPLVASCSAASSDTSGNGSSMSLWDMVPECAQSCVENFVKTQYTAEECTTPSNIQCLCRTETPSGLTLGEGALTCVYALCEQSVIKSSNVYHICDSVSGALPKTHPTITATTFPNVLPTTTTTTDTTASDSSSESASTTSTTTTSATSTTSSLSPEITVYHPSSSASPVAPTIVSTETPSTSATDSQPEKGSKHVSAGTVIGASVAAGAAGSFIIGVAVFFCCKRWRQHNRVDDASSSEFEIGGTMTEPPGWSASSSKQTTPRPGAGPSSPGARITHQEMSQSTRDLGSTSQPSPRFYSTIKPNGVKQSREQERVGFAVSSDIECDTSPRTLSSQNTLAELLPGQTASLYPKPLKWNHRPVSRDTLFEEDELQRDTSERRLNLAPRSGSPNMITGLPANPRAFKEGFPAQRFLRSASPQTQTQTQAQIQTQGPPLAAGLSGTPHHSTSTSNDSNAPIDSSGSCGSQHTSTNTLLTTPFTNGQARILSGTSPGYPEPTTPTPAPASTVSKLAPPAEIISRPRIVKANDIKRVEIRSSPRPRPPSEVISAYCPEDLWLERSRTQAPQPASSELPYPSETCPGAVLYPSSPEKQPHDRNKRVSPTSRNLTPSRRGDDLILRVD